MNKNTIIIAAIVLIIVAAVGGFYAGKQYQRSQVSSFAKRPGAASENTGSGQRHIFNRNGRNSNFRPVRGKILSIGNNTITVKLANGGTKIVILSGNTVFTNTQKAAQSELKTGDTVNVAGTANSDGSVTALDVQINPQGIKRPAASPSASQ